MDMEAMAAQLLQVMESMPSKALQHKLGDYSRGEFFLLNYLHKNGRATWPSMMSEAMQTSTARIAAALNNLERKRYVIRESDAGDGRRKLVRLTSEGVTFLEEHRMKALENIRKLLVGLGEYDASEYLRITQRIELISRDFIRDHDLL